jgi:hypothetical protein
MSWKTLVQYDRFDDRTTDMLDCLEGVHPIPKDEKKNPFWSWVFTAMKKGLLMPDEYRRVIAVANGHS